MEMHTLKIHDLHIAYTEWGPQDGRILLCVHGMLSNGRDYDALAAQMAQKGYRVIAIDLPGRGRSDWFKNPEDYTLPAYIPYVQGLIQTITQGAPYDYFGVSLGGMIGMALAAGEPESKMARLILVDIGAEIPGRALNAVARTAKTYPVFGTHEAAVAFLKDRCAAWGITQPVLWDHLIAHNLIRQEDGRTRLHYDPQIGVPLSAQNETLSLWPLWQGVTCPVLLIRGSLSELLPPDVVQKMQTEYQGPHMTVREIAGCGHVPNMMQPDHIAYVESWLTEEGTA